MGAAGSAAAWTQGDSAITEATRCPGQEMVEPGVVLCDEWGPDGTRTEPLNQVQECIAGGVGRTP